MLFNAPSQMTSGDIIRLAEGIGLPRQHFEPCLSSPDVLGRVANDAALAERLGIKSTPAFLVGTLISKTAMRASAFILGAKGVDDFSTHFERLLEAR
jgi:predicted DsbA family dithiol-disulfide isomerase